MSTIAPMYRLTEWDIMDTVLRIFRDEHDSYFPLPKYPENTPMRELGISKYSVEFQLDEYEQYGADLADMRAGMYYTMRMTPKQFAEAVFAKLPGEVKREPGEE